MLIRLLFLSIVFVSCAKNELVIPEYGYWYLIEEIDDSFDKELDKIPLHFFSSKVYIDVYGVKRDEVGIVNSSKGIIYIKVNDNIDSLLVNENNPEFISLVSLSNNNEFKLVPRVNDKYHKSRDYFRLRDSHVDLMYSDKENIFLPSGLDFEVIISLNKDNSKSFYKITVDGEEVTYLDVSKITNLTRIKKLTITEAKRKFIRLVFYVDKEIPYSYTANIQKAFFDQGFEKIFYVRDCGKDDSFELCYSNHRHLYSNDGISHYLESPDSLLKLVLEDKLLTTFSSYLENDLLSSNEFKYGSYSMHHPSNHSGLADIDKVIVSSGEEYNNWRREETPQNFVRMELNTEYFQLWNGLQVGEPSERFYNFFEDVYIDENGSFTFENSGYHYEIQVNEGVIKKISVTTHSFMK